MPSQSNSVRKYENGSYLGEILTEKVKGITISFQRHGRGTFYFNNGDVYDGNWINDKMEGQGVFKWPNGTKYEGNFSAGLMNGQGKFSWPDGRKHDGLFKNGKKLVIASVDTNLQSENTTSNGTKQDPESLQVGSGQQVTLEV
jgi:hypothetical protein